MKSTRASIRSIILIFIGLLQSFEPALRCLYIHFRTAMKKYHTFQIFTKKVPTRRRGGFLAYLKHSPIRPKFVATDIVLMHDSHPAIISGSSQPSPQIIHHITLFKNSTPFLPLMHVPLVWTKIHFAIYGPIELNRSVHESHANLHRSSPKF